MEKSIRRRLSLIYLLHMGGSFIFLFLVISALLQFHWRDIGSGNALVKHHLRYQWKSLFIVVFIVPCLFLIPHDVTQLLIAYGLMLFNLARAAYGSYKLRKSVHHPSSSDQNVSLRT